jgi:hypothetical protein
VIEKCEHLQKTNSAEIFGIKAECNELKNYYSRFQNTVGSMVYVPESYIDVPFTKNL